MKRVDSIRNEVRRLIRAVPFRRFLLNLEKGDRVVIEHPENIAFDPTGKTEEFDVISGKVRMFSTFGAVTGVVLNDREGKAA